MQMLKTAVAFAFVAALLLSGLGALMFSNPYPPATRLWAIAVALFVFGALPCLFMAVRSASRRRE